MAENSESFKHIKDGNAQLSDLIHQALRRYGDPEPESATDTMPELFLDLANEVIDEVRSHPYWTGETINYLTSIEQASLVPDNIMKMGLLAKYAKQQVSAKAPILERDYLRTLNQQLWYRINGNSGIRMRVVDDGTNPKYINHMATSDINGSVS